MISSSHIIIGGIVCDFLKQRLNINLNRQSFIRGNVIPDYSMLGIIQPHFPKMSLGFVQKEIAALSEGYLDSENIGVNYSLNLGIVCHYLSDFFCYAHSAVYKQFVINHVRYEKELHKYLEANRKQILKKLSLFENLGRSAEETNKRLNSLLLEYNASAVHDFERDIGYIIKVCVYAAMSVISCALEHSAAADEVLSLEPSPLII